MSTVLKEKIESRMKAKKLSIPQLERMAGLKIHAVRNILKGRIKNPTAENLRAIANVLECSIIDLMGTSTKELREINKEKVLLSFEELKLLQNCLAAMLKYIKNNKVSISVDDFLHLATIIYTYSVSDDPKVLDPKFLKWTVKNFIRGQKGYLWHEPGL